MRYWIGSLAIVAVVATTGCNHSPAGPEATSPGDSRLVPADDPNLPWTDLSALRFQGLDPSTQIAFDLVLEGIGARYWPDPEFAPGPNWQPETRWLQFTGDHGTSSGANENQIEGGARIQETPQGLFGLGKVTAVVSGTYTTPLGTERVTGTLIFDLAQDLVVPIKGGSFFAPCGTGCIDFGVEPLFNPDPNFNLPPSFPVVGELILGNRVPFTSIDAGGSFTCALSDVGEAYCWGDNDSGQLGDGTRIERHSPVRVSGEHSFSAITVGGVHACGLSLGTAYCWGSNSRGQLGDGTLTDRLSPVPVATGLSFRAISAGSDHTCGLTHAGAAYCWGSNLNGQLGDGTSAEERLTPVPVTGGIAWSAISSGLALTCGVTMTADPYCWGDAMRISISYGNAPVAIEGLSASAISAAVFHVCALTLGGAAYCWGINLGDGGIFSSSLTPVPVAGGLVFTAITGATGGSIYSCGLTTSGGAYCWGDNVFGQLGDGTTVDRHSPVPVTGGLTFSDLGAGGGHACGVAGGRAYCWGANQAGQLGNGTTTSSTSPVAVLF
jgi:hypothetical protein